MISDFSGFFKVWYNKNLMVNILSFRNVRKNFFIAMDTDVEITINVHLGEEKVMKFKEVESGLYFFSSD